MAKGFLTAWDQVELSQEADERIRAALAAAQKSTSAVIPLRAGKTGKRVRSTTRFALAAAVMICLLSVTALAVGIGRIMIVERETKATDIDTGETAGLIEVGFEPTSDSPVLMGVWAMQTVPEGFEQTDSFYSEGYACVRWERAEGGRLDLTYTKGGNNPGSMALPSDIAVEKEDVPINDGHGTLYTVGEEGDYRALVWTDEEKGVGFTLIAQDGADDVDLTPLAESVALTGRAPEISVDTLAAIAELGDWAPASLPDGYSAYFDQGTPGSSYGGTYSYVRRFYVNDAGNTIELRCETPVNDSYEGYVHNYRIGLERPADLPDGVCTVTDTTVQGLAAGLIEYPDGRPLRLVWLSEDGTVAFLLSADGLTSRELLDVAGSVACLVPPTATPPTAAPESEAVRDAGGVLVTPDPTARPTA